MHRMRSVHDRCGNRLPLALPQPTELHLASSAAFGAILPLSTFLLFFLLSLLRSFCTFDSQVLGQSEIRGYSSTPLSILRPGCSPKSVNLQRPCGSRCSKPMATKSSLVHRTVLSHLLRFSPSHVVSANSSLVSLNLTANDSYTLKPLDMSLGAARPPRSRSSSSSAFCSSGLGRIAIRLQGVPGFFNSFCISHSLAARIQSPPIPISSGSSQADSDVHIILFARPMAKLRPWYLQPTGL
jgi:hypothetical protein